MVAPWSGRPTVPPSLRPARAQIPPCEAFGRSLYAARGTHDASHLGTFLPRQGAECGRGRRQGREGKGREGGRACSFSFSIWHIYESPRRLSSPLSSAAAVYEHARKRARARASIHLPTKSVGHSDSRRNKRATNLRALPLHNVHFSELDPSCLL